MPSVSFILCSSGSHPVGGLRIIYEYANRLVQRSWRVYIIHPAALSPDRSLSFLKKIRRKIGFLKDTIFGSYRPDNWFTIDRRVQLRWVPDLSERHIPDADNIVACPVQTADIVNSYNNNKGKKFYFIQHFEDWIFSAKKVEETWRLPLKKIVISRWLQEKASALGLDTVYIPNGLDFSRFSVDIPFSQRNPYSILFLSHFLEIKGTTFALNALLALKQKFPALTITAFGIYEKPSSFPDFITYYRDPPQKQIRALYNSSRIFIASSLSEGWGLTACEAMMCGCAVVATDIPGHREFIVNKENALFCAPASVTSIVEAAGWLMNNPAAAEAIAHRAPESLKKFDWPSRVTLFEKALRE